MASDRGPAPKYLVLRERRRGLHLDQIRGGLSGVLGTGFVPPRPFLAPAAARYAEERRTHRGDAVAPPCAGSLKFIDAYTIGISLALNNGVSDGIAAIRRDLDALDRAVTASRPGLVHLRQAADAATAGAAADVLRLLEMTCRAAAQLPRPQGVQSPAPGQTLQPEPPSSPPPAVSAPLEAPTPPPRWPPLSSPEPARTSDLLTPPLAAPSALPPISLPSPTVILPASRPRLHHVAPEAPRQDRPASSLPTPSGPVSPAPAALEIPEPAAESGQASPPLWHRPHRHRFTSQPYFRLNLACIRSLRRKRFGSGCVRVTTRKASPPDTAGSQAGRGASDVSAADRLRRPGPHLNGPGHYFNRIY